MKVCENEIAVQRNQKCGEILKEALSGKKMKAVVACLCDGRQLDLSAEIPVAAREIQPIFVDSPEGIAILRHSAAHIMAGAVKELFPLAKVTIGPNIEDGFYYDFDVEEPFSLDDLERITLKMNEHIQQDLVFCRTEMLAKDAKILFEKENEPYKVELINDLGFEEVSVYTHGAFKDLCRGPHIPNTGFLKVFKLLSVAGSYWRGDEKKAQLQRIYGIAFAEISELKSYLLQMEEAKKRDHRKLGSQLNLFSFSDEIGGGMPLYHPKGALIRAILEDFLRKIHLRRGYNLVQGPQILRKDLWVKSGHYDNYRDNMYFTEIDDVVHGIKPMNCLSHMIIYNQQLHSYRELPIRMFELGVVHRHEKSGVLHGLFRVRQFTQDDAHILCRPDQLQDEIIGVLNLIKDLFSLFGFEYILHLSTRPSKSIGSDEMWSNATEALKLAMDVSGHKYEINEGDGAFYGPKIDIKVKDAIGRLWQCSTIQCDFVLPERFGLEYVGEDGARHRPVMLHRAIFGSIDRFLGILIEHYVGAFPLWLAPVQAKILTVTESHIRFAEKVSEKLRNLGYRVETDFRNEKLGYKVREAQMQKIPYSLIVGDEEVENAGVSVRALGGKNLGFKTLEEVANLFADEIVQPFKQGGMSYSFNC